MWKKRHSHLKQGQLLCFQVPFTAMLLSACLSCGTACHLQRQWGFLGPINFYKLSSWNPNSGRLWPNFMQSSLNSRVKISQSVFPSALPMQKRSVLFYIAQVVKWVTERPEVVGWHLPFYQRIHSYPFSTLVFLISSGQKFSPAPEI